MSEWKLVPLSMNPEQRQLMLRADEFTVDEMWIMLLAAAAPTPPVSNKAELLNAAECLHQACQEKWGDKNLATVDAAMLVDYFKSPVPEVSMEPVAYRRPQEHLSGERWSYFTRGDWVGCGPLYSPEQLATMQAKLEQAEKDQIGLLEKVIDGIQLKRIDKLDPRRALPGEEYYVDIIKNIRGVIATLTAKYEVKK